MSFMPMHILQLNQFSETCKVLSYSYNWPRSYSF